MEKPQMKPPRFASLFEFVDQFLLPMYGTTQMYINSVNWSAKWWAHPEAVARLDGLWRTFEQLRIESPNTHIELFLRLHGDYHMRYLMQPDGVFSQCRREDFPTIPLPSESVAPE